MKGPEVSKALFGGVLEQDGSGFYPGLELINLVYHSQSQEILPKNELIHVKRVAHDFARRLIWDETIQNDDRRRNVVVDELTESAVKAVMESLQLELTNIRKRPTWERAHFFPYSKSLIHYDARGKASKDDGSLKIQIERRYLRGAGALAFKVLRMDPDIHRLNHCRSGFTNLFKDNNSPLERLAKVLADHGKKDDEATLDQVERETSVINDLVDDVFRDAVDKILSHSEIPTAGKVKALMIWTGFWVILCQQTRSANYLDEQPKAHIIDCANSHPQLRRASQRSFKEAQATIANSINAYVIEHGIKLPKKSVNSMIGFFNNTAATINLLNGRTGRRHFTIGLNLLEALVFASTEGRRQISFEDFATNFLYDKCNLVVTRNAAEKANLLETFDASIFEDNENYLASQMKAAGLLIEYSDATRMVATEGLI